MAPTGNSELDQLLPERTPYLATETPVEKVPEGRARYGSVAFWADLLDVYGGTLPVSGLIAVVIGTVCGVFAYFYFIALQFVLKVFWVAIPRFLSERTVLFPEVFHWMWIPLICMSMSALVGYSIQFLGDPGDAVSTVSSVHKTGYINTKHVAPMIVCSLCSIVGAGSLGPEAPVGLVSGSIGGFLSRYVFRQKYRNVVRKHTLNGLACSLSAFAAAPLGGSLFALESTSRLGYEYFEHALESILCGTVCVVMFRHLSGLPIGPSWSITEARLGPSSPKTMIIGAVIGLAASAVSYAFAKFHAWVVSQYKAHNVFDNPVDRALVGGTVITLIGLIIPHTLFWGMFEFPVVANLLPVSSLPHIWPTRGIFGFEITGPISAFTVGVAKMLTISATISGGYRGDDHGRFVFLIGGFIFPFFTAGAAFGRAITYVFPSVPPQIAVLCFAGCINVAISRAALATTALLVTMSGEVNAGAPLLLASIVTLFATSYMPFIKTQQSREDLKDSVLYSLTDTTNVATLGEVTTVETRPSQGVVPLSTTGLSSNGRPDIYDWTETTTRIVINV